MTTGNKLRIFVDAHGFDKEFQGSRTFIKEIYALLALKNDLQLFMGAYDIQNLSGQFKGEHKIIFIKYKSRSKLYRLLFDIPAIIRKYAIDYAHFQYVVPVVKKCRFIVTIHDVLFMEFTKEFSPAYRLIRQILWKKSARKADLLTTVSAYSKNAIEKNFTVNPEDIHVIQNAVHPRYFECYDKQAASNTLKARYGFEKIILCVSRLEPRKNHVLLLQTYLELKLYRLGYHLVLLGYESINSWAYHQLKNSLPQYIRSMIYESSEVNDETLLLFYRSASVFVYPSLAEGFGIPPLEAAAVRIPVLCSNATALGAYEFFGENHVDPGDHELFKSRLSDILQAPPDGQSLDKIAEKIKQDYNWEYQAEQFYHLIINNKINLQNNIPA